MLHLIPDDGQPHAPTAECGCGPVVVSCDPGDGTLRPAIWHPTPDELPPEGPVRLRDLPGGFGGYTVR